MNRYITEQEARAIFKDEMRRMVGATEIKDIRWLPTSEAYQKLNYPSQNSIREAVKDEFFRVGIEVQDRRRKNSTKPVYYFNISACLKRLNTPPEKREISHKR
jgi:hypothetical protein